MTDLTRLRDLWNGWQPPPELQRSRPRPVRFTAKGKAIAVVAFLLLVGGIVGAVALYRRALEERGPSRLTRIERPDPTPLWAPPLVMGGVSVAALLIGLKLVRERRLLEDGQAAPGVVTRVGARTDKGRRVYYEFATYDGSAVKGSYGPVHGKWVLPVATPIVVLHDRDDPKRSTRYPSSLVTLNY